MTLFQTIFFLFLFLLLSSLWPSTSAEICRVSCGIQSIRFPFRLDNQPDRCGYPRFSLSCKNKTQTVVSLPFSGDFDVINIDYMFQNIWINDPHYCSMERLLRGLNVTATPFALLYPQSFTFFNCSAAASTAIPEAKYIPCLSGRNFSVVAIPEDRLDLSTSLSTLCSVIATVPVPISLTGWSNPGNGIMLTWNEPNCLFCESRAGNCLFKSGMGMDVGCSDGFGKGLSRRSKYGLLFGVGIPILFVLGLIIYLRNKAENSDIHHPNTPEALPDSIAPRLDAAAKGLDGKTIEAYPVTLVGESRRLPRPNDSTCPICLGEYVAKETLRTIPDCKHYFHAGCIDEWLKLNAACPLCRKTPEPLALTAAASSLGTISVRNQ